MRWISFFSIITVVCILPLSAQNTGRQSIFFPANSNFALYNNGSQTFVLTQTRLRTHNMETLSAKTASGKRVRISADDPAAIAIATEMESSYKSIRRESMNAQDYRNYKKYAESLIGEDIKILQRIRELVIRSGNTLYGPEANEINQTEIDQLKSQIDMNARFSTFNTKQVYPQLTSTNLGLDSVDVTRDVNASIYATDRALDKLNRMRSIEGISTNILTLQIQGKELYYYNLLESESRMTDLDMGEALGKLKSEGVLLETELGILVIGKE